MINSMIERIYAATGDVTSTDINAIGVKKLGAGETIQSLFASVINIVLWVAGALAVVYLIYSGILYITAAGNPDAAKKGQQGIINAVIGIIIVALALVIVGVVSNVGSSGKIT